MDVTFCCEMCLHCNIRSRFRTGQYTAKNRLFFRNCLFACAFGRHLVLPFVTTVAFCPVINLINGFYRVHPPVSAGGSVFDLYGEYPVGKECVNALVLIAFRLGQRNQIPDNSAAPNSVVKKPVPARFTFPYMCILPSAAFGRSFLYSIIRFKQEKCYRNVILSI